MTTTCPSEETLAAFIDQRLDGKSRSQLLEHVAGCGECRDIVVTGSDLAVMDGPQTENVVRGRSAAKWMPLAAAAAIAVVLFAVTPIRERLFGGSDLDALVEAANTLPERTTAARLSGDFAHRDYRPKRGVEDEAKGELAILVAAAPIQERAEKNPSTKNLHALGVAYMLTKDEKLATDTLERAVNQGPVTPELLTDLSAAYLMQNDDARARDTANKAWAMKQTPAAAWNIAVALEMLDDPGAANAWRKYLELDSTSDWAKEARQRLSDLQQR